MAEAKEKISQLKKVLPGIVKEFLQLEDYQLGVYIEKYIDEKGPASDAFSSSKRIGAQSGAISRALIPKGKGHISRVVQSGGEIRLGSGIDFDKVPHATYQEQGRKIQTTPRMEKFFWAMYMKSRADKWKILALFAKKGGVITLPARPFYAPGVEDFQTKQKPKLDAQLHRRISEVWNA